MKLATTTADFRDYADTPAGQVALFEGTGFRHLDLNLCRSIEPGSPFLDGRWEEWVGRAGEDAAALGMDFCQAHAPCGDLHGSGEAFDVFLAATVRSIEAAARLGISHVVVHAQDIGGYPSRKKYLLNLQRNRAFFSRLFPAMDRTGVAVLLENSCDRHAPTPAENTRHFPSTAAELLELTDHLGHPLAGICWDTGHAHVQGLDQYASIRELGTRLRALHVADNRGDMDSHLAPFQGTMNIDSIMQGLVDTGYQGFFTFEAGHLLRNAAAWPHQRREWHYRGAKVTRLADVPLALRRRAVALLYGIGRHILEEYGCFEE